MTALILAADRLEARIQAIEARGQARHEALESAMTASMSPSERRRGRQVLRGIFARRLLDGALVAAPK